MADLITLMYIAAHNYYTVSSEDVAEIGRTGFIYPLELKVDDTPENAII